MAEPVARARTGAGVPVRSGPVGVRSTAMQRNLKLTIAYDGTDFHGWQRQLGLRTVQAEVEEVARRVIRFPVELVGASRTDAGVHAQGQVAHLHAVGAIPADNLRRAIAHRLPPDVTVVHVADVPRGFHATRDAECKLYRYRIHNDARRPTEWHAARWAWHVWWPLDLRRMQAAGDLLTGSHDFAAFASAGSPRGHTVRTVRRVHVRRRFNTVAIDVEGTGFLYNQVRNMAGTLVEVGRGHWPAERVAEILDSRERRNAGPTAPAHGLCLQWIKYPPDRSLPDGA
jgi:tRNA pseudouridine38-40 synthase